MLEALLLIFTLFVVSLGLRNLFPKICAICLAVTLTWLYGLFSGWNAVVLALLMGGSAVGSMYYLGSKLPEKFGVFKLPYLLSALVLAYAILEKKLNIYTLLFLVGLWILSVSVFFLRNGVGKNWFKKVVECCKNW